jgi:HEAT repeat protein
MMHMTSEIMANTLETESRITITGDGNVIGDYNTVIVYQGERPVSVADVLSACQAQVKSMVQEARHKYDPALYVHRAIEQELRAFFTIPWEEAAPNCYVIVAPAGSGKTNLLCHLAGEHAQAQPAVLLMGGSVYLSPTSGLFGALQSELQAASRNINFRHPEDCLHTLHRAAEEMGSDALVILDAINEHDKPLEMRKALEDLLHKTRGKRIKLLITCRDFYWGVFKGSFREGTTANLLPAEIAEDEEGRPEGDDFNRFTVGEQEIALGLYLHHYGISGRPIGDAAEQCRHPLLLRFFCEAYRGQEVGELEDIRLKELFDRYWDQKLASVAERMIKHGDERILEALQEELGDYLLSIASYMLRNNVRAIPEVEMPKATCLSERRGDPSTVYGRIRDEFIILEERERGQGRRKMVQVAFVYEEFMEYTMALSLLRDWEAANLDERAILAAIDALAAQYTSFAQVLGVMVYVGLMLREERGITLWSALMKRGGPWRGVVLEAIRKLPDSQIDANVYLVLEEVLSLQDVDLTLRALDILKSGRFGRRAPRAIMQRVCDLVDHSEESVRRRVMLAAVYAPIDLRVPVVERGLRDRLQGVRENALISTLSLPAESALGPLGLALSDDETRIRRHSIAGLVHLGELAITLLAAALRDDDSGVRRQAAEALKVVSVATSDAHSGWYRMASQDWAGCEQIGSAAVEPLVVALRDSGDSVVRRHAAEALGRLSDSRAVEPLVAALRDSDWDVWQQAAAALISLGEPSVFPLMTALRSSDWDVWQRAAAVLISLGEPSVLPLVAALRDSDRDVRCRAAEALGRLGDSRAVEPLAAALRDSDRDVRCRAAEALVSIGDSRAVEPLVAALRDSDWDVRCRAAEALGQLGDSRAAEPLVMALRDSSGVRWLAAEALGQLGDSRAAEPLVEALYDRSTRRRAAVALSYLGDNRAVQPLLELIREWLSERRVRCMLLRESYRGPEDVIAEVPQYFVESLIRLEHASIMPIVTILLEYPEARSLTAHLIHRISPETAPKEIITALNDQSWQIRAGAVEVLSQYERPSLTPLLLKALRDWSKYVRSSAAEALGRSKDEHAVEPLVSTAFYDPEYVVRTAARSALGQLGTIAVDHLVALVDTPDTQQIRSWQDVVAAWKLQAPDENRFKGAQDLDASDAVKKSNQGQDLFVVGKHLVRVAPNGSTCDCPDFQFRQKAQYRPCKHLVAVAMYIAAKEPSRLTPAQRSETRLDSELISKMLNYLGYCSQGAELLDTCTALQDEVGF